MTGIGFWLIGRGCSTTGTAAAPPAPQVGWLAAFLLDCHLRVCVAALCALQERRAYLPPSTLAAPTHRRRCAPAA